MSRFVLVHAATFAAWSWFKIVPRLEQAGHTVIARDLPGHGRDRTAISDVTFQSYLDSVSAILDEQDEPVILVGHSMGGGIVTGIAEQRPDRIEKLVYLAALLPKNGQSMMDCFSLPESAQSLSWQSLEPSADRSYVRPRLDLYRESDCADCSDEDWALIERLVEPESSAPFLVPLVTTAAHFGRVPKVYIETTHDRSVTLPLQRRLQQEAQIEIVLSLDTSHCPNFSAPDELVAALIPAGTSS